MADILKIFRRSKTEKPVDAQTKGVKGPQGDTRQVEQIVGNGERPIAKESLEKGVVESQRGGGLMERTAEAAGEKIGVKKRGSAVDRFVGKVVAGGGKKLVGKLVSGEAKDEMKKSVGEEIERFKEENKELTDLKKQVGEKEKNLEMRVKHYNNVIKKLVKRHGIEEAVEKKEKEIKGAYAKAGTVELVPGVAISKKYLERKLGREMYGTLMDPGRLHLVRDIISEAVGDPKFKEEVGALVTDLFDSVSLVDLATKKGRERVKSDFVKAVAEVFEKEVPETGKAKAIERFGKALVGILAKEELIGKVEALLREMPELKGITKVDLSLVFKNRQLIGVLTKELQGKVTGDLVGRLVKRFGANLLAKIQEAGEEEKALKGQLKKEGLKAGEEGFKAAFEKRRPKIVERFVFDTVIEAVVKEGAEGNAGDVRELLVTLQNVLRGEEFRGTLRDLIKTQLPDAVDVMAKVESYETKLGIDFVEEVVKEDGLLSIIKNAMGDELMEEIGKVVGERLFSGEETDAAELKKELMSAMLGAVFERDPKGNSKLAKDLLVVLQKALQDEGVRGTLRGLIRLHLTEGMAKAVIGSEAALGIDDFLEEVVKKDGWLMALREAIGDDLMERIGAQLGEDFKVLQEGDVDALKIELIGSALDAVFKKDSMGRSKLGREVLGKMQNLVMSEEVRGGLIKLVEHQLVSTPEKGIGTIKETIGKYEDRLGAGVTKGLKGEIEEKGVLEFFRWMASGGYRKKLEGNEKALKAFDELLVDLTKENRALRLLVEVEGVGETVMGEKVDLVGLIMKENGLLQFIRSDVIGSEMMEAVGEQLGEDLLRCLAGSEGDGVWKVMPEVTDSLIAAVLEENPEGQKAILIQGLVGAFTEMVKRDDVQTHVKETLVKVIPEAKDAMGIVEEMEKMAGGNIINELVGSRALLNQFRKEVNRNDALMEVVGTIRAEGIADIMKMFEETKVDEEGTVNKKDVGQVLVETLVQVYQQKGKTNTEREALVNGVFMSITHALSAEAEVPQGVQGRVVEWVKAGAKAADDYEKRTIPFTVRIGKKLEIAFSFIGGLLTSKFWTLEGRKEFLGKFIAEKLEGVVKGLPEEGKEKLIADVVQQVFYSNTYVDSRFTRAIMAAAIVGNMGMPDRMANFIVRFVGKAFFGASVTRLDKDAQMKAPELEAGLPGAVTGKPAHPPEAAGMKGPEEG